ncbi:zinc-binding dehydrogenase [Spirosoma telluris]|uniref:zinc-binding dehydrogenase n=1 Tax=Spirosoma telluris TaxID=2183553 RepID=UPI002FC31CAD
MRIAKLAGAAHTINTTTVDLHEALMEITDGDGPDVIIEAVGNPATYGQPWMKWLTPVGLSTLVMLKSQWIIIRVRLSKRNRDFGFAQLSRRVSGCHQLPGIRQISCRCRDQPRGFAGRRGAALADWSANPGPITKIMVNFDSVSN